MMYIKFKVQEKETDSSSEDSLQMRVISKILDWVVPRANPTLEGNIDKVSVWYVEYDTSEDYTNREIGLDVDGNVIFKAPYEDNLGYWVDNDLTFEDYKEFNPQSVSAEEFGTLWERAILI